MTCPGRTRLRADGEDEDGKASRWWRHRGSRQVHAGRLAVVAVGRGGGTAVPSGSVGGDMVRESPRRNLEGSQPMWPSNRIL
jgi:hypothetical protein